MQNNQYYPKPCTTATDIMSNHRFDNRGNSNKKKWSNKPKKDEDENTSNKTPNKTNKTNATSFAQGGKEKTNCSSLGKTRRRGGARNLQLGKTMIYHIKRLL
jgi:hypothetical protein